MTFWQRFRFAWRYAKKFEEAGKTRVVLHSYEERVEFFRSQYPDGEALERRVLAAQCTCEPAEWFDVGTYANPDEKFVIHWDPECLVHTAYVDDLTDEERREIDSLGSSNT